jgi:hypothetical protein
LRKWPIFQRFALPILLDLFCGSGGVILFSQFPAALPGAQNFSRALGQQSRMSAFDPMRALGSARGKKCSSSFGAECACPPLVSLGSFQGLIAQAGLIILADTSLGWFLVTLRHQPGG